MKVNKTVLAVTFLIVIGCLIAYNMYLQNEKLSFENTRYYLVEGDSKEGIPIAYEIDKKTGQTWLVYGYDKTPHAQPDPTEREIPMTVFPSPEQAKITGHASFDISLGQETFSGRLYNGSDWTVKEVTLLLTVKEKNGLVRWSRRFRKGVTIKPLTTSYFSINVVDTQGIDAFDWYLIQALGYKRGQLADKPQGPSNIDSILDEVYGVDEQQPQRGRYDSLVDEIYGVDKQSRTPDKYDSIFYRVWADEQPKITQSDSLDTPQSEGLQFLYIPPRLLKESNSANGK